MNHRIYHYIIILFLMTCVFYQNTLYADRHSSVEVTQLIQEVTERLENLKQDGAEDYAPDEVREVALLIGRSSQFLSRNEQDKAYYEIIKARGFFQLIEARKKYIEELYIHGDGIEIPSN